MPRVRTDDLEPSDTGAYREPQEVGNREMEVGPDAMYVEQKTAFQQCIAHDCPNAGAQMVVYEVDTRWPNGRRLLGSLQFEVLVCEEHFEKLVRGKNIRV